MKRLIALLALCFAVSCSERSAEPRYIYRSDNGPETGVASDIYTTTDCESAIDFALWVKKYRPETWYAYPPNLTTCGDSL